MPNLRRFLLTALLCLFAAVTLGGVVRAVGEPSAPPAGAAAHELKVKVERPDQPTVEGVARFHTVRMKVSNGTLDLDLGKVHSLTVEVKEPNGTVRAAAEFGDHSRMTGELLTPDLPVTLDGTATSLAIEPGLKVKFIHEKQTGLVAALLGLLTLTLMEIVLGIDNVIFLAIVAGKLPEHQQRFARRIGLGAALGTRLLLLCTLSFLMGLTKPLFTLPDLPFLHDPEARGISWRDLILIVGGLFLVGKSVKEVHEKIETAREGPHTNGAGKKVASFASVILQIAIIDIIFSLDSVITAVGMVEDLWVMVTAVIVSVGIMLVFAEPISRFVDKHPTIKLLALSFLILIGVLLLAEGLGQHVDKGYIYFAMGFAVVIELLNQRLRPKPKEPASAGENI
ncbi:MAG: TerC family protein [Fimbriiglobus sp.]|jgi:predicted tellurium resistance membrane protein TerC|nr:TerC family protein [Fimbriiglobus sp.]